MDRREQASRTAAKTWPSGWVFRAIVSVHLLAIVVQPVFAGVYLSGDYDSLGWHEAGANVVTAIGYVQLAAAVVVWVRLRQRWPLAPSIALVVAETVQYYAGMHSALWLHIPLGVMIVAAVVVQFIAVWRGPLARREAVDARA